MREREIRFGVLLNAAERLALARMAEATGGLSLGAMVRHLIRTAARQRAMWPPEPSGRSQANIRGDSNGDV